MSKTELTFGEKTVEKKYLYNNNAKLFETEEINLDNVVLSKKKKMTKKIGQKIYHIYNIGYDDNGEIVPSVITLPQMIGYYNIFEKGKTMNFICDSDGAFKKYKEIWEKIRSLSRKMFTKEPVNIKRYAYIYTKIRKR